MRSRRFWVKTLENRFNRFDGFPVTTKLANYRNSVNGFREQRRFTLHVRHSNAVLEKRLQTRG